VSRGGQLSTADALRDRTLLAFVEEVRQRPACQIGVLNKLRFIEKSLNRRHGPGWVLFLRDVAQFGKDNEFAALDIEMKPLGVRRRDQLVEATPKDQSRNSQCGDAIEMCAKIRLLKAQRMPAGISDDG
jgi:hypothetical protein